MNGYLTKSGWHNPTGIEFESELINVFEKYSEKFGTLKYFKDVRGTDFDTKEGTDLFVDGIRVDVTANFSEKHLKGKFITLEDVIDANGTAIKFGIRLGNRHFDFQTPVMVVGIDAEASFLNNYMDQIVADVSNKIESIMDIVNTKFYDYCDENDIIPEEMEVIM